MAWMGLINRARVNFGTECAKLRHNAPEVSISVYGAGPPLFDCFFVILHECGRCVAWMGLINRARVNFGTECPKIPKPCQVTLSDVTTLPEVSISINGAGLPFGTLKTFDCFFVILHECGSAWHGWG